MDYPIIRVLDRFRGVVDCIDDGKARCSMYDEDYTNGPRCYLDIDVRDLIIHGVPVREGSVFDLRVLGDYGDKEILFMHYVEPKRLTPEKEQELFEKLLGLFEGS